MGTGISACAIRRRFPRRLRIRATRSSRRAGAIRNSRSSRHRAVRVISPQMSVPRAAAKILKNSCRAILFVSTFLIWFAVRAEHHPFPSITFKRTVQAQAARSVVIVLGQKNAEVKVPPISGTHGNIGQHRTTFWPGRQAQALRAQVIHSSCIQSGTHRGCGVNCRKGHRSS